MAAVVEHAFRGDVGYYEERAVGLLASAEDGTAGAVDRFGRWNAPLTPDGAREVLARQHGLATWEELREHVEGLGERGDPFAAAVARIEAHDPDGLSEQLRSSPGIVDCVGTNGNDLVNLAA